MSNKSKRWLIEEEEVLLKVTEDPIIPLTEVFKDLSAKLNRSSKSIMTKYYRLRKDEKKNVKLQENPKEKKGFEAIVNLYNMLKTKLKELMQ